MHKALQRRANERPLVGCYAELGRREPGCEAVRRSFVAVILDRRIKAVIESVEGVPLFALRSFELIETFLSGFLITLVR